MEVRALPGRTGLAVQRSVGARAVTNLGVRHGQWAVRPVGRVCLSRVSRRRKLGGDIGALGEGRRTDGMGKGSGILLKWR